MALFGISDLHLSLGTDKPMDVFPGWKDYVFRLEKNWRAVVSDQDTVVIGGDISWALKLEETEKDFAFLHSLPGRKVLLKGNHDLWWSTAKKLREWFQKKEFSSLEIVYNSALPAEDKCICGTRGWFYDAESDQDKKVLNREVGRLSASIEAALATGLEPVVFLHYPPVYRGQVCTEMMETLKKYGIRRCYYGHIHGSGAKYAETGTFQGVELKLISCDFLGFLPMLIP